MQELPTGTVTFLFTDVEGSTKLASQLGPAWSNALEDHRRIIRSAVAEHGGHEFGTEGDALFAVFGTAIEAVAAAGDIQRGLADAGTTIRVRIGVHTGDGVVREDDYVGLDVHRVARIAAAGHGGQTLVSSTTMPLVEGQLPPATRLRNLGEHRLKDLQRPEHLYQLEVEGVDSRFPPLRGVEGEQGNLPVQLTSFVGRQHEIEEGQRLLDGTRLLTLTGPGGTGKTRLSLQLATAVRDRFSGGAWFVALAALTDPELVPTAIADALGLVDVRADGRSPLERVLDHIRSREILLVLDNFEQVTAAAGVVTEILRAASMAKIVVTSRAALRVYGEREYPVPPLRLPDPRNLPSLDSLSHYEAVSLFIDRARAVRPDFEVTNDNAAAVAEICARLDGLPLAIELAAARIRLLTPDQILARMGDRLALLSGGARDLPARQRTLREAISWSYDLLDAAEQRLFARIGAFAGGCLLDEAEQVCGPADELGVDVLDGLTSLTEKSLVTAGGATARFALLETIREYALERLRLGEEGEEIRRRHARAYLELAERAVPSYVRRDRRQWLERLEPEHDNLRAAIEWAIGAGDASVAQRLATALWRFWQMRGHLEEGRMWTQRILAMPRAEDHPAERARALEAAGGLAYWQGDQEAAVTAYEEAIRIAELVGDKELLADTLYDVSFPYTNRREAMDVPRASLERAKALYEELGHGAGIARATWGLANERYVEGDFERAIEFGLASLEGARAAADEFQEAWSQFTVAVSLERLQRLDEARARMFDALSMFADAGDLTGILFCIDFLSDGEVRRGEVERGARLTGAAASLRSGTGADLVEAERQAVGRLIDRLPREQIARALAEGAAMTVEQVVAYALGEADHFA